MSGWMYSDIVKEHFMNPRNILEDEESFREDGRGVVGNIKCGDQMLIVISVDEGTIADCKWRTYGCASAIASTSMLSEVVIGMKLSGFWPPGSWLTINCIPNALWRGISTGWQRRHYLRVWQN